MSESILEFIRPGDRVTIAVPGGIGRGGQEYTRRTGRAVMRGPYGWVLNLGGRHGTPGVAGEDNIIHAPAARRRRGYNPYIGHGVFKQEVSKPTWNRYFRENLRRIRPDLADRVTGGSFPRGRIAYDRDELGLSPGQAAQSYAQIAGNPHGGSMHWGRHLGQMGTYKPVSQKTHRQYIAWLLKNAAPGEEVPTFDKHEGRKYSIRADMLEAFRRRGRNPGRRKRRRNRGRSCPARIPKRKWIQRGKCKGKIHKGKLHRKLQRWYGLSPNKKIPRSMLAKAYRRAKKRGDTKTMRQINLAKVFKKVGRKRRRKSRRRR